MNTSRKIVTIIFLAATLFSTVYLSISAFSGAKKHNDGPLESQPQYTIKEYKDKIAVFKFGSDTPDRIIEDIYVRDLPTYDRDLLKNGINAADDAELNQILEDYDG